MIIDESNFPLLKHIESANISIDVSNLQFTPIDGVLSEEEVIRTYKNLANIALQYTKMKEEQSKNVKYETNAKIIMCKAMLISIIMVDFVFRNFHTTKSNPQFKTIVNKLIIESSCQYMKLESFLKSNSKKPKKDHICGLESNPFMIWSINLHL